MAKLDKETKVIMADFLDSLRDYMHESHNLLCFDERESDDFVDTYEKQLSEGTRQPQSGRHLIIPDVINWVAVKDELPEIDKRVLCARAETSMAGRKRISNAMGFVNKNGKFSCEMDWVDVDYWVDIKPPCL